MFPARAVRSPDFLALSVPLDFAAEVVRVPLVPERTLPFDVAQRVDAQTAAIRAFAPFAARHLAGSCAAGHARDLIGIGARPGAGVRSLA